MSGSTDVESRAKNFLVPRCAVCKPQRIVTDALTETIDLLTLSPEDDGETWAGVPPAWFGEYVFGGVVVAQAIAAATRDAPAGRRLHSLHAYFLRPVLSS